MSAALVGCRVGAGFLLQYARNNHDYNASDHCHDGAPATYSNYDNNDAYERQRLLRDGRLASVAWRMSAESGWHPNLLLLHGA